MGDKKFLRGFATRAIHANIEKEEKSHPISMPIYQTSSFDLKDHYLRGESFTYVYTRSSNPTLNELEVKLASLENGDNATCVASGMGAISTNILAIVHPGDEIIADYEVYGGTRSLLSEIFPRHGVKVNFVNMTNLEEVSAAINEKTRILFIETPANPTLKLTDLDEMVEIAKKHDLYTIVDNTFNSPVITRPLEHGIDFVLHSMTKFIGGHGDAIGGIIITNKEHNKEFIRIGKYVHEIGACLSPFNAYLFLRGLKTLEIRIKQQCINSMEIAKELEKRNDKVEKVLYPGLKIHPQHELAKKQMNYFGSVVSFYLKKGSNIIDFMKNLEIPYYAVSLGDTDSLIQDPYSLTHFSVPYKVKKLIGITKTMIRYAVGIENVEDLIDDLNNTLDLL